MGLVTIPQDTFFGILVHLPIQDVHTLVHRHTDSSPDPDDWRHMLALKYPVVEWDHVDQSRAIRIDDSLRFMSPLDALTRFVRDDCLPGVLYLLSTDNVTTLDVYKNAIEHDDQLLLAYMDEHHPTDVGREYPMAIADIAARGSLRMITYLVREHHVNPAINGDRAIVDASCNGHLDVVKYLASVPGVDPSAQGNAAIALAASNRHVAIVSYLLTFPAVYSANCGDALTHACSNGDLEAVECLMTYPSVRPTQWNNRPLEIACSRGYAAIVKHLVTQSDIHPPPSWGLRHCQVSHESVEHSRHDVERQPVYPRMRQRASPNRHVHYVVCKGRPRRERQ